jgi:hypothetical protein
MAQHLISQGIRSAPGEAGFRYAILVIEIPREIYAPK